MKSRLAGLLVLATTLSTAFAEATNGTKLLTFNDTIPSTRLTPRTVSLDWVAGEQDGDYIFAGADRSLIISNAVTGTNRTFVPASQVPAGYRGYWINSNASHVLFATNATQQYRHSYFANYSILDVATGTSTALVPDQRGDILYAEWSPIGDRIAFVRGNDIYLWSLVGEAIERVTSNGGPDTFNGMPDWVYEEEVFAGRSALWWSPDGTHIAYLSFNETGVGRFDIQYNADNTDHGPSYPRMLELRYPKAGSKNPTVGFNLIDVETAEVRNVPIDAFPPEDLVVGEVAWLTSNSSNVVYRAYNRVQDSMKLVNVHVDTGFDTVIRERAETTGWLDNSLAIQYVGAIDGGEENATYYLDVSDESGWNHLYLFPTEGGTPIALTCGKWEVRSILKVDRLQGIVYYTSTERHSTESHVYSISYRTMKKHALVDNTVPGYWTASFSANSSIYQLSYLGPDVPHQYLYSTDSTTKPLRTLEANTAYAAQRAQYKLPQTSWFEIPHPSGSTLNILQRLPANFDPSKSYPVLFNPYGGPGSQSTSKLFQQLNWNAYLSSDPELEYIQWVVDNRGTGYKGRSFRAQVRCHLGDLEAQDQIYAAQWLTSSNRKALSKRSSIEYSFSSTQVPLDIPSSPHDEHDHDLLSAGAVPAANVDSAHVTHWGWSFGGYLTAKVLERNSGVFTQGLITAPVTDWRFYDSVYTERYMKTPALNPEGYNKSAVRNAQGFKDVVGGFEIFHGLGDDNVHYQNTAVLTDLLMHEGVTPASFSQVAFSDSSHSISYGGDRTFLYRAVTQRLWAEKRRTKAVGKRRHQWSKRALEWFA